MPDLGEVALQQLFQVLIPWVMADPICLQAFFFGGGSEQSNLNEAARLV
jgi:hypothetical protein